MIDATLRNSPSWTKRALILLWLALMVLCVLPSTVRADPAWEPRSPEAKRHLTAGNRHYRLRDFTKAVDEYKAGALLEEAPIFHFNLGQCYRLLIQYDNAIWHYERFLARVHPPAKLEATVRTFIEEMNVARQTASIDASPKPASVEPTPSPRALDAATMPASSMHLNASTAISPISARRKIAIVLGSTGVAVIGVGFGLGLRARGLERDAAELCPMPTCDAAIESNKLIERGKANALYSNIAFGAGSAAIIAAAVIWIMSPPKKAQHITLTPHISDSFAGLSSTFYF